jgi:DNA-binding PadR family transcriptional regulator
MHGHHIRRRAELVSAGEWGEVAIGGLYALLHRLEEESLLEPVRREQSGNFPARTVYGITPEGRAELARHRRQAFQKAELRADPVDVAVMFGAGCDEAELRQLLDERKRSIASTLASQRAERQRLAEHGYLRPASVAVFRHWEQRLEAELRWHKELSGWLGAICAERENPGAGAPLDDEREAPKVTPLPKKPKRPRK